MSCWILTRPVSFVLPAALLVAACGPRPPGGAEPGGIPYSIVPTKAVPSTPELLALGKKTFEQECIACHGAAGNGEGDAAYLLYPRPRDFTSSEFRIISTWDGVPTDDDLFRTISRGMPGSAMPSWAHMPEETRWGLVHYVKSFAKRPLTVNGVETLGLALGQIGHSGSHDFEARRLEATVNLADDVLCDRIGLDDGQGSFDSH